jgi:hypothetical protein
MTRSFASYRTSKRKPAPPRPRHRDRSITAVGFTCFRLVAVPDPEPDEQPFVSIELCETMNAMGAFLRR